jgi:cytoskeletal protein RodZ
MTDNKNTIIAIVLSAIVLIAWQFFVGLPQQKARQEQLQEQQQQQQKNAAQSNQNAQHSQNAQPAQSSGHRSRPGKRRRRRPAPPSAAPPPSRQARASRLHPTVCKARSTSRARASTTWRWSSFTRPSIRSHRRLSCCHRPAVPTLSTPSSAGPALRTPSSRYRPPIPFGRKPAPTRSASVIRQRSPTTTAKAWSSAAQSRSTTSTCSLSRTRW